MDNHKTYCAEIELGKATDTFDGSGKIVYEKNPTDIDINKVTQALEAFKGTVTQTPPMFSALKHQGQPLYKLARAGVTLERKARMVKIYRLELINWQSPLLMLEIECSKGTYIRSVANDLGEALGCGAYLKSLTRTRYGIFSIEEAISLTQLEEAVKSGDWQQYLHPIDSVLQDIDAITVDVNEEAAIKTGNLLKNIAQDNSKDKYLRAYSRDGRFLGILKRDSVEAAWRPKKVFI
jgi:tRNA pseudouridine55 synthase